MLPNNITLSTNDAVNKEVKTNASVQSNDVSKMRGEYIKLTAKDRATIGEYAAKMELQQLFVILVETNNSLI